MLDLGRGRDDHRRVGMHPVPAESIRHRRDLVERELRRRKDDDVELVAGRGIAREKRRNLGRAD
jgi:hypothetical protein